MLQTPQAARLAAAQADFANGPTVPSTRYCIEPFPFNRFTIETEIKLPVLPPFTKAAFDYFGAMGDIVGITQCEETGTYMLVGRVGLTVEDIAEFIESIG